AQLGQEMQAKREEIQMREEAVRTAWAASGELGAGPAVLPLMEAMFQTIDDYLELGARFEQQLQKLRDGGGAVEDWMSRTGPPLRRRPPGSGRMAGEAEMTWILSRRGS
ncbi:MAG: hypothetical protein ACTSU0_05120, partial [Alphaproteobacteria bacterium]